MSHHDDNATFDPNNHKWGYEINAGLLSVIGIAGTILMYVICLAIQSVYLKAQDEYVADKSWMKNNQALVEYQAEEDAKLKNIDQNH